MVSFAFQFNMINRVTSYSITRLQDLCQSTEDEQKINN